MFDCLGQVLVAAVCSLVIYKILDRVVRIPRIKLSTLQPKNIVITGCDSGFGNLFAKRMDKEGFQVFACCLTEAGRLKLDTETSDRVKPFIMDVSSVDSITAGFQFVSSQLKPDKGIWALVNNAGIIGHSGPVEWLSQADYEKVHAVNLYGVVNTCRTFIPLVRKSCGRIIITASIAGRVAMPISAAYATSKFALEGFSDVLRYEMKQFNISVHVIEPGFFATAISDPAVLAKSLTSLWRNISDELREVYGGEDYYIMLLEAAKRSLVLCSHNLTPVVNSYEHAVTAVYPRGRYMPGWTAWLILWPLSHMPEWLLTFLFGLGLRRKTTAQKKSKSS